MENELHTVYQYFSHYMRNCTAMIAASATLLSNKMVEDEEILFTEVTEASFFLDLFDAGMELCFMHVFGNKAVGYEDIYTLEGELLHFVDQCKMIISERDLKLNLLVKSPSLVRGNAHDLKTLTNIIVYEMVMQSRQSMTLELIANKITISSAQRLKNIPKIWDILKDILAARSVEFIYDDTSCSLEYRS